LSKEVRQVINDNDIFVIINTTTILAIMFSNLLEQFDRCQAGVILRYLGLQSSLHTKSSKLINKTERVSIQIIRATFSPES